jgi:tetratricopeptide (TPR) repeat protein
MARAGWAMLLVLVLAPGIRAADPPDPLAQARLLYNQRDFDAAIAAAERIRLTPELAHRADLIAARAYLERYRQASAVEDLNSARERLRRLDPRQFDPRERTEFIIGLGEALYFDQSYGAAAEVFEPLLETGTNLDEDSRERVLDWWAISVDRDAWLRAEAVGQAAYERIRARMRDEIARRPGSATAAYWLAAAARSQGDLEGAWEAAEAGWVRAGLAPDRGVVLRADLDRLMMVAIVPERARATGQPGDALLLEWQKFKERWGN